MHINTALSLTRDFHEDIHRNIVSLRVSEDLFDDLSDNPDGWKAAIDLEIATKPHTYTSHQPVIARPFEEADYNEAIEYPFSHWSSSRYSNGSYGVWYGADTLETSIYETVHHWRSNLLKDANWQDVEGVEIERKVYLVRCDAAFLDFREKIRTHSALIDAASYHLTHREFTMMATQALYQDLPVARVIFAPFLINGFYPIQDTIVT